MPFGIPPRQNPVQNDVMPSPSLQGTMTNNAQPGGMMLPKAAMQGLPPDYQSMLTSPSLAPAFESTAPEEPQGGQKALDYILGALGGLLQGGAPGLVGGIMGVRDNMRQIREEQRIAAQESARDKMKFITEGLTQGRADKLANAEAKLREAKLQGDENAVNMARQDVENAKSKDAAARDRQEAELEAQRSELKLAQARLESMNTPDHEAGLAMIGNYGSLLEDYKTQLNDQITAGTDGEPVLRKKIGDTVYEVRGVEAIRNDLEAGLENAVNQASGLQDPEVQERLRTSYQIALEPLLERWSEKVTLSRVARAKKSQAKAKEGARKFKTGQERREQARAVGRQMGGGFGGSGFPPQ